MNFLKPTGRPVTRVLACLLLATSFLTAGIVGTQAEEATNLSEAIKNGKWLLNARLRYEHVDQASFVNDADALTIRTRFGYKTAPWKGFSFLIEGDFTQDLGVNDFNSTTNGKVTYPVIADPNSQRLNRASVTYTGIDKVTLAAGRQRFKLDNDRFIGNVGWRQNEQTYDSAMFQTKIIKDLTVTYVYVWQVNRIFGSESSSQKLKTNTNLVNLAYNGLPFGTLVGYAYLINVDGAAAASNQSYGIRFSGAEDIGDNGWKVNYWFEYAHQSDYGNSTSMFSLDYFHINGGFSGKGFSALVGFENLEGNGSQSFRTPLATLHAFNGFADQFLATPANGLRDLYFVIGYTKKDIKTIGQLTLKLWYHDFSPDVSGAADLGEEIDFLAAIKPLKDKKVTFSFKLAKFKGSPVIPNITKFWISAEYAF